MKKLHTFLPVMVVACLLMLLPITKAEAAEGKPGQNVSVTFSFDEIRGLDGDFTFSNEAILEDISYSSTFSGVRFNGNKVFYSTTYQGSTSGSFTVTATIKKDAPVGSNCMITLDNINITDANTNSVYSGSKSEVLKVVEKPVVTKAPAKPTATPASQDKEPTKAPEKPTATPSGNQKPTKAPTKPTATEAVKTEPTEAPGTSNQGQNVTEAPSDNKGQNVIEKPGDSQSDNNSGSQSIEVTKRPQNNDHTNNSSEEGSSIEATRTATVSPSETPESEVVSSKSPDKSIEANAGVNADKNKKDNDSNGKSFWIIFLILSIIANLILAGILIWRKVLKNADTGKDTPLVDYDINEDDEPLETEEIE